MVGPHISRVFILATNTHSHIQVCSEQIYIRKIQDTDIKSLKKSMQEIKWLFPMDCKFSWNLTYFEQRNNHILHGDIYEYFICLDSILLWRIHYDKYTWCQTCHVNSYLIFHLISFWYLLPWIFTPLTELQNLLNDHHSAEPQLGDTLKCIDYVCWRYMA